MLQICIDATLASFAPNACSDVCSYTDVDGLYEYEISLILNCVSA